MRRHVIPVIPVIPVILCALIIAACAKNEQAATDTTTAAAATPPAPAPIALADVAGTWEGKAMPMDRDTVVTTFEVTATATNDGWKMKLANGVSPTLKVVSVAGDSIVTEAGPYASATRRGQQVSVHQIMRLRDGKLVGVTHARYSNGDTATFRTEATKKTTP
jgi:hypothetical protein